MTSGVLSGPDLHRLMFGLLYPAVLGSFFFLLLPAVFGARTETSDRVPIGKNLTGWMVVLHFIVDFHLTSSLPAGCYRRDGFLIDLLILIALFKAFDSLNVSRSTRQLNVRWAAVAIAMTYALFLLWSFYTLEDMPGRRNLLIVETVGLILFIIVATRRSAFFLGGSLLLMSITMTAVGSPLVGSLRDVREYTCPAKTPVGPAAREAVKAPPAGRAPNSATRADGKAAAQ